MELTMDRALVESEGENIGKQSPCREREREYRIEALENAWGKGERVAGGLLVWIPDEYSHLES